MDGEHLPGGLRKRLNDSCGGEIDREHLAGRHSNNSRGGVTVRIDSACWHCTFVHLSQCMWTKMSSIPPHIRVYSVSFTS